LKFILKINPSKTTRVLIFGTLWFCLISALQTLHQVEPFGSPLLSNHLDVEELEGINVDFLSAHHQGIPQGPYFEIQEVEEENEEEDHFAVIELAFGQHFIALQFLVSSRPTNLIEVFQPKKYLLFHDLKIDC
jgi:hypothetical protein